MPLPKIEHPLFEVVIPSTKKKIKVRQMLVKEEKILLMAKESEDFKDIILAIRQVVNNCIADADFDIDSLALFDLEYIFMKLRALSMDNIVKVSYKDKQDDQIYDFEIDLNSVQVHFPEGVNRIIRIGTDTGIEFTYPRVALYDDPDFMEALSSENDEEAINQMIINSFVKYFTGDSVMTADKKEEVEEFIEQLDIKTYSEIRAFFTNLPELKHEITYTNSLGNDRNITLSGLSDFFSF